MLRTVRSLPSLRLLCQQETNSIKAQTKANSTYSYISGDLFQSSTNASSVRYVHQTTKKETILLDSSANKSKYTSMNLQGLKMECKKRGLKVSGRKIDLVQRLVSQDQIGFDNSRPYTKVSTNDIKNFMPPNPKFVEVDKEIRESKIAQLIKNQNQNHYNTTIKRSDNQQNKTIQAKKSLDKLKAKKDAKELADKKAKNAIKFLKEEKAKEEWRLQMERDRELELIKQKEMEMAAKQKAESIKLQAEKELKIKKELEAKEKLKAEMKLADSTKKAVRDVIKQSKISTVLAKAQESSKAKIIANAKQQLQIQAREQQQKQKQQQKQQQQQQQQKHNDTQANLSSRDVKFLSAFGVTTIGWWSLKDTSVL